MISTAIDGSPSIRTAWPEGGTPAHNGPVHTLQETADYLASLGYPRYSREYIRQIEDAALAKLRQNLDLREVAEALDITTPDQPSGDHLRDEVVEAIAEAVHRRRNRKPVDDPDLHKKLRRVNRSKFLQKLYYGKEVPA